jgi:hypothetical protein
VFVGCHDLSSPFLSPRGFTPALTVIRSGSIFLLKLRTDARKELGRAVT